VIVSRGLGQNKHFPLVTMGYGLALIGEVEAIELMGNTDDDDLESMRKRLKIKDQNNTLLVFVTSAAAAGVFNG
jgi:hypothetical protein